MRKSMWVGLLGAALVVVGLSAAVWIGPDDWVDSPAAVLNSRGEVAVVTNYGLLSQAFPMRVSASNKGGEVFVGIAHVVDADDYLGQTTTSQVGWFGPDGVRTERRTAERSALPAAPSTLDLWRTSASGSGTRAVEGAFRGQPVVAVVTTPSGIGAPLQVQLSSRFVGAFAGSLTVAGLGLALLLTWWWRRKRLDTTDEVHPAPGKHAAAAGVSALVLALGVSGCTAVPAIGSIELPQRAQVTRNPLDGFDVARLAADYNRRVDAATAASSAPRYSATQWANASAELILHRDLFNTAWNKATKDKTKPEPCPARLGAAYPGPSASAYPLTVVVTYGWACGKGAKKPPQNYAVFVRNHSYSPWLHAAIVGGDNGAPVNPGTTQPAASASTVFEQASTTIANQLTAGKAGLDLPADLTAWRKDALKPSSWATHNWVARPLPGAVRVFQTEKGAAAVVSLTITEHTVARPGQSVVWGKPWSTVYRQPGSYERVASTDGLMLILTLTDGHVKVNGWYSPNYL